MSGPSFPKIVLVDGPTFAADVRFDLNSVFGSATCVTNREGFSLGAPTLDAQPGVEGGEYGNRTITLTSRIEGPKAAALGLLSALARELLRPDNWLLVQLDALTPPAWFHLYQSPPAALSLDEVYVDGGMLDDAWQTSLTLSADAFAYGELTTVGPVTVTQTPDGAYPMRWELPALKGDAPTALRVDISTADTFFKQDSSWLVGCASSDKPVTDALIDIGSSDGLTENGDTNPSPQPDSSFFAGSYRAIDFPAGGGFAERLDGLLPEVLSGRYRVLMRAELDTDFSGTPTDYYTSFGVSGSQNDPPVYGPTVTTRALSLNSPDFSATFWRGWIDLGNFNFPAGTPQLRDVLTPPPAATKTHMWLQMGASRSGQARIDSLKFIPLDPDQGSTRILIATFPTRGVGTYNIDGIPRRDGIFDGDSEVVWTEDTRNGNLAPGAPWLVGGFPSADPGAKHNVLFVMATSRGGPGLETTGAPDVDITRIGSPSTVTVSYFPRYLHLPGDVDG